MLEGVGDPDEASASWRIREAFLGEETVGTCSIWPRRQGMREGAFLGDH